MDFIPFWAYLFLTLIVTAALAFHASEWGRYRVQGRGWSHATLLIGWASIAARLWHGVRGDESISYTGAIGLTLLSLGVILRSVGK